ncbi:serine/threonine protein kinase [Oleoguttula sp. CCFEE 5521]
MATAISVGQSMGGLRIANPDDTSSISPTETPRNEAPMRPLPPSSHSSGSTITGGQRPGLMPTLSHRSSDQGSGLNFGPVAYPSHSGNNSPTPSQQSRSPRLSQMRDSMAQNRLSHRKSMPLDWQAQQAMQYPSHSTNYGQQMRPPGMQTTSIRPISGMYSQQNGSSSSGLSSQASYGYRGELSSSDGTGVGVQRRGSRSSRQMLDMPPSRESSRTYRQSSVPLNGGNGPLPPRRNSRRARGPAEGPGDEYDGNPDEPYSGNAPVPRGTDEWNGRGAAQGTQQETDTSGQQTRQIVKKGVKDFTFGRTLGEGSYSTVLAATDRQNLKEYAIKVLDKRHIIKEKKVKYVNIERDTLNRLTEHPGVVRLYYTFQDERSLYFVLDLASGGELLGVLKKMGSFDIECSRFYAAEILDTIAYMHSRGVIHRDLKPENVLLDRDMHVKITDFGTAKILKMETKANGAVSSSNGEMAGNPMDGAETDKAMSFVGTAEYVSPELLRDKNACKASDLWAFGCIIYQLLAGRPPFKAANEYLTFQKILALEYSFPEGFPEVARDLVERLLVLEPSSRLPVEHIMNHRFFDGVRWGKDLWKQKAPRLKAYVPPPAPPIKLGNGASNGMGYGQISSSAPAAIGTSPSSALPGARHLRNITELPPPSQLDIEWLPVLTHPNERILKLGNLIVNTSTPVTTADAGTPSEKPKFSRFFSGNASKKRERLVLITSSARVIMAAAGGKEKKAKMDFSLHATGCSFRSFTNPQGLTAWCVDTRDKHITFEDPRATTSDPAGSKFSTQEWIEALESAREIAAAQSSVSGGSSLLEDSPADSLGGDAVPPMISQTRGMLRKDRGGGAIGVDDDGGGTKKRFSKRSSRSGLAAVF